MGGSAVHEARASRILLLALVALLALALICAEEASAAYTLAPDGNPYGFKFSKVFEAQSPPAWYNTNWKYRIPVTLSGTCDYPFVIWFFCYYGSGTSSGTVVYFNSLCRSDFADVKFVDQDGVTELPYVRVNYISGSRALFFVRVPSAPRTIYIYFSGPSAYTGSWSALQPIYFNHFDSALGSEWTVGGATASVSYSVLSLSYSSAGYTYAYFTYSQALPTATLLMARLKFGDAESYNYYSGIISYYGSSSSYNTLGYNDYSSPNYLIYGAYGATNVASVSYPDITNIWYYFALAVRPGSYSGAAMAVSDSLDNYWTSPTFTSSSSTAQCFGFIVSLLSVSCDWMGLYPAHPDARHYSSAANQVRSYGAVQTRLSVTLDLSSVVNARYAYSDLRDVYVMAPSAFYVYRSSSSLIFLTTQPSVNITLWIGSHVASYSYSTTSPASSLTQITYSVQLSDLVQLNPFYILEVYDEERGGPFNMTLVTSVAFRFICEELELKLAYAQPYIHAALPSVPSLIRMEVEDTVTWYRDYKPPGSLGTVRAYAIDVDSYPMYYQLIEVQDPAGAFTSSGAWATFKRYVDGAWRPVAQSPIQSRQASTYLVDKRSYQLELENALGAKAVLLFSSDHNYPYRAISISTVPIAPTLEPIATNVQFNVDAGADYVTVRYVDKLSMTSLIKSELYSYNLTKLAELTSSGSDVQLTFSNLAPGAYYVFVTAEHQKYGALKLSRSVEVGAQRRALPPIPPILDLDLIIPLPSQYIIGALMVVCAALAFTQTAARMGAVMLAMLCIILWQLGLLPITVTIAAFIVILAIVRALTREYVT